ncbi:codanin-1 [Anthonomus grandis grandis]|uniref:codanin-1 n=1 Tax=Anthonomus grandis grandis TaxID=2921223 RepID=UPI00216614EC|nr:codanin-1 [Anthonomus grandis grandis]
MSDILLNKLINDEVEPSLLTKWLLEPNSDENKEFQSISDCKVSQIDFITYFLNFLHEELPCNDSTEIPKAYNTPKKLNENDATNVQQSSNTPKANADNYASVQKNSIIDTSVSKFSTPKASGINKHESYFSPVSPLYQNPNLSFQNKSFKNSTEKPSLCLGDFLVTSTKTSAKKKRQSLDSNSSKKESIRRINPTNISIKPANSSFEKSENSFNFQDKAAEVPVTTVSDIRGILVKERTKILSRKDSLETTNHQILLKRQNSLPKTNITPLLNLVTFQKNLDNVASIYKVILAHKLVLNITSELYFLISLILSNQSDSCRYKHKFIDNNEVNDSTESNLGVEVLDHNSLLNLEDRTKNNSQASLYNSEIFGSIHNVVYFAVKCLESQFEIIQVYDKTTLRLLADNERIKEFSPKFSKELLLTCDKKTDKLCLDIITPTVQAGNVCFNIDTDNADNFPDRLGFQAFKKQRDMFYEILRIWETNHLSKDWSFSLGLGGKIRSLFSFHNDPMNYTHLARLFKNQLLRSCAKGAKEKGLSETNLPFVPSLDIDADKLKRLTNRLVTKQSSNGINSLPVFSGYQEFFKDFIIVSSNPLFNRHICDSFTSEIIELNDIKFSTAELEDKGNEVDQNSRNLYIDCIQNLRILAKFLGFLESLPYKSELTNLPKNVIEIQIKIRKQHVPQLDVKHLLQQSISANSVIFIIPWLINYLAMLDYVSLRLPYFLSLHNILFDLYRNYEKMNTSFGNAIAVRFCLGWLFELPHFPDAEYFNFYLQNRQEKYVYTEKTQPAKLKMANLDSADIINQNVLYLCCPYLEEIKKILATNAPGSKVAVKYITPVTAVESNIEVARKKIEQQVEDAFFNSHPSSVRKTVEFVSERIASAAVKHICHDVVPNFKTSILTELKEIFLKNDTGDRFLDDNQRKTTLKNQGLAVTEIQLSGFLKTLQEETEKISCKKIPSAIDSLLPVDTLEITKNICIRITNKMYTERVKQWIDSHVTLDLLTKDFENEVQKRILNGRRTDKEKIPFVLPPGGKNCNHNEDALSGFHALNALTDVCCRVNERNAITIDYIVNILQETHKCLTERNDINDTIAASLTSTVFEFSLLLIVRSPSLLSSGINIFLPHCLNIWTMDPKPLMLFKTLFCPRNLLMLQSSSSKSQSLDLYARVISALLEKKLINVQDLESQCTGFYSRDWDKVTLEDFSYLLKQLVSYYDNIDCSLVTLLDFLSDFCSDL